MRIGRRRCRARVGDSRSGRKLPSIGVASGAVAIANQHFGARFGRRLRGGGLLGRRLLRRLRLRLRLWSDGGLVGLEVLFELGVGALEGAFGGGFIAE